ncbi:toll/interleukin-1 receptor domain-containing adapter protein [Pleurodeles waltl]|uniref:toll/interleukin-1 receptor domain-containing adapter protein n=1 Tax=Pleurodeles waltl TaxID=8319 RepID=UPI00370989C4
MQRTFGQPGWLRRLRGIEEGSTSSSSSVPKTSSRGSDPPPCRPPERPAERTMGVEVFRKSKKYDVCVCHCEGDLEYALDLVSYLEGQSEAFRCFLQLRDAAVGGAIPSELCNALSSSHCWLLLITPQFLEDCWCNYQMQQALALAPVSNGCIIPFIKGLEHAQCPRELTFMYKVWASSVKETGFLRIKTALLNYFKEANRNASPRGSCASPEQWTKANPSSKDSS